MALKYLSEQYLWIREREKPSVLPEAQQKRRELSRRRRDRELALLAVWGETSFPLISLAHPLTSQDVERRIQIPPYTPLTSSKIVFEEFLFLLVPLSSPDNQCPVCT